MTAALCLIYFGQDVTRRPIALRWVNVEVDESNEEGQIYSLIILKYYFFNERLLQFDGHTTHTVGFGLINHVPV